MRRTGITRAARTSLLVLMSTCLLILTACPSPANKTVTVLVGAGEGSASINVFLPETVRIRVGDTVNWKMNADGDPHSVTFISKDAHFPDIIPLPLVGPGAYIWNPDLLAPTRQPGEPVETYSGGPDEFVNSGTFFGAVSPFLEPAVPIIDEFSLTFDTPGSYWYVCIIHEFQQGMVIVELASATDLPTQEDIDAQAQEELEPLKEYTDNLKRLLNSERPVEQEAGPNGTSVWIVKAGIGPREAELSEFFPKHLTIKEGDTVVWQSSRFHAIVINDTGNSLTQFYQAGFLPDESTILAINPDVVFPFQPPDKTPGEYDGTGSYSSGLMGPGITGVETRPGDMGWSLTFTEPGVYGYTCPIHLAVGMVATITVEEK